MKNLCAISLTIFLAFFVTIPVLAETFQGVNYTIIKKSNSEWAKKGSIDIRLDKKVTKDFLQKLALKLRQAEPRKYDRFFIAYYLPDMIQDAGAWATSHFNPNLEVKILGISLEQEKALMSEPKNASSEIIGEWLDESPYARRKYTFFRKNEKVFMIEKFADGGSSPEKEMIEKNQSGRLRFEEKGKRGNGAGDYWLIEKNGNLGLYDNIGLFNTMRPTK